MTERYTNNATTHLASGINTSQTTINVTNVTNFPTSGNFRIAVGSEIMLVTTVSGTTWTVTRGAESTTPVAAASNAIVTQILTKGALDQIRADNVSSDTFANRPASEIAGRLFLTNNSFQISRDGGTSWASFVSIWPIGEPPNTGTFTWSNQGSATVSNTANGGILLTAPAQTATTDSLRLLYKSAPATPYKITASFSPTGTLGGNWQAGICLLDSVGGKIETLGIEYNTFTASVVGVGVIYWNSTTSFNSSAFASSPATSPGFTGMPNWYRMQDNGTNRLYEISWDGFNFMTVYSIGRTTNFTANAVGFFANTTASNNAQLTLFLRSWAQS